MKLPVVCFLNTGIRPMNGNRFVDDAAAAAALLPFFGAGELDLSDDLSSFVFTELLRCLSLSSFSGTRGRNSGYRTTGFSTRRPRERDRDRERCLRGLRLRLGLRLRRGLRRGLRLRRRPRCGLPRLRLPI